MKTAEGWRRAGKTGRYKKPGLQGPVDDAFKDAFLVVRPTGKPENKDAAEYINDDAGAVSQGVGEVHARRGADQGRQAVTEDDIERYHLILFGDLGSNKMTKRIAPLLMRAWPIAPLVPVLIAPNPLNRRAMWCSTAGTRFTKRSSRGRMRCCIRGSGITQ